MAALSSWCSTLRQGRRNVDPSSQSSLEHTSQRLFSGMNQGGARWSQGGTEAVGAWPAAQAKQLVRGGQGLKQAARTREQRRRAGTHLMPGAVVSLLRSILLHI